MKFKNHVMSPTIIVLALGMAAVQAKAEQGKFNLPVQARWGAFVLEPGEYQLSVPQWTASWPERVSLTGNGKTVWILASTEEERRTFDRSSLTLVNVGGRYAVSEFSSKASGKSFTFNVPRAPRHEATARGQGISVAIEDNSGK